MYPYAVPNGASSVHETMPNIFISLPTTTDPESPWYKNPVVVLYIPLYHFNAPPCPGAWMLTRPNVMPEVTPVAAPDFLMGSPESPGLRTAGTTIPMPS